MGADLPALAAKCPYSLEYLGILAARLAAGKNRVDRLGHVHRLFHDEDDVVVHAFRLIVRKPSFFKDTRPFLLWRCQALRRWKCHLNNDSLRLPVQSWA